MKTHEIRVKGTDHYQAKALYKSGALEVGASVNLVAEPTNPYDENAVVSSPQIMYHFSIEFLELAVSCLGLGEGGCDCTALAMH